MTLLQVQNVSRHFGSLIAVNDVSLTVEPGELRAVIGPNGAGKTTFFNLISGFFPPTSGKILLDGRDITNLPAHRRVAHGHGADLPDHRDLPRAQRARESAHSGRGRERLSPSALAVEHGRRQEVEARVFELMEMGGLAAKADRLVGELPHGDQRATEIMMSLALKPRLLLLDEPTAGMGDQETYDITRLIRRPAQGPEAGDRADRA